MPFTRQTVAEPGQRLLQWVCWLYVPAVLFSLLLTGYAVALWHVALPSYDLVDHHAFLAAAAEGRLDWPGLWERHNGVHLIVLPKLVFWLDMRFTAGQGRLVTVVSALVICATCLLVLREIRRFPGLTASERRAFSWLWLLMASSVMLLESLLNPIDVQWSLLALGTVLLAGSLSAEPGWTWPRTAGVVAGLLVCWLSGGPMTLLLLAVLLTRGLTAGRKRLNDWLGSWRVLAVLAILLALLAGREWYALQHGGRLLLMEVYRPFTNPADWIEGDAYLRAHPDFYASWMTGAVYFMARFVLLPLGYGDMPAAVPVALFLPWLVLLWRSVRCWQPAWRFFILLVLFGMLLGFGAGVMRLFNLYNFRHANMGFLVLSGSLLLLYAAAGSRQRTVWLAAGLLAYLAVFMRVAVDEAGAWTQEGSNMPATWQIGDALGVRDPTRFAPVWKVDDEHARSVAQSRQLFRQQRAGIYGSSGYRYFRAEQALPPVEVTCDYRLLEYVQNDQDPRGYLLRGTARTADGHYLTRALFLARGEPVGWADTQMPSAILWEQWRQPWQWGGYLLLADGSPGGVAQVVAFDDRRRCQPWPVPH